MKIKIIPVKQEYYPGETISGKIQIIPDKNTLIEDIEISLSFSEEWNYLLSDKKNEKTNNNQLPIFVLELVHFYQNKKILILF